jgi:hypothetical protein
MRGFVPPDPYTKVSEEQFAVVYVPKRSRNRFPANCVEVLASSEEALTKADPENKKFAARVLGPSKSSEGQYIYYLMEWLE